MNASTLLRALLLTACSAFWTLSPAQNDSLVLIEYDRLRKWAANRSVGDDLLREISHDFARQHQIIILMEAAEVQCDSIAARQLREIDRRILAQELTEEAWNSEKKKNKVLKWLPFGTLALGVVIGTLVAK